MEYKGLTTEQWERVYNISKKINKSMDELIEEIEFLCPAYDNMDELMIDFEEAWTN